MYKIGLSTCGKRVTAELCDGYREAGIEVLEVCYGTQLLEEIVELVSVHKDLRVCFDTNHLLNQDPCDFVRKLGDKIITLHISDYDFQNERHWLPGEGDINWPELISTLKETGYSGPWLYELGLVCPKSIIRPRELTYEDIANNARELFAGKKPTTISTRIEGLGMWPE